MHKLTLDPMFTAVSAKTSGLIAEYNLGVHSSLQKSRSTRMLLNQDVSVFFLWVLPHIRWKSNAHVKLRQVEVVNHFQRGTDSEWAELIVRGSDTAKNRMVEAAREYMPKKEDPLDHRSWRSTGTASFPESRYSFSSSILSHKFT